MNAIDELTHTLLRYIEQYGWYLLALVVVGYALNSVDWTAYLPSTVTTVLTAHERERNKELDKHMRMIRREQIRAFASGASNLNDVETPTEVIKPSDAPQTNPNLKKSD